MSNISNIKTGNSKGANKVLLRLEETPLFLKANYDLNVDERSLNTLIEVRILPVLIDNGQKYVLFENVKDLLFPLSYLSEPSQRDLMTWKLFWRNLSFGLKLSKNTEVIIPRADANVDPAFYAGVINLGSIAQCEEDHEKIERVDIAYFQPTRLITNSRKITEVAQFQVAHFLKTDTGEASQFANSAYYMGSKRRLRGFLVEAISSVLPGEGILVDLMCGSGVASGAFSKIWRVFSSDAQEFCRLLAIVQGSGFSVKQAEALITEIVPVARDHATELTSLIKEFLEMEDFIFHSDTKDALLHEYRRFIGSFPVFPDGKQVGLWDPVSAVNVRKCNKGIRPYCLFTAYFANQYFGLRQCVEIDSLRYAIDQIENEKEKQWALGALIATLSALGTTHAGHFAQPVKFDVKKLPEILEKRAQSVIQDFCVRLLNLSDESERACRPVELLPGPWSNALTALDQRSQGLPVCVYVDAPYKRDEYSRYYHVLETAVTYSYPSCVGHGKTPDKEKGERFKSEFFTKTKQILNERFCNLFHEILKRNWVCAWSYSDSGDASVLKIVEETRKATGCKVKMYSTPYKHNPIGKGRVKQVTEYLILFTPPRYTARGLF